jgi:hypothetical protein
MDPRTVTAKSDKHGRFIEFRGLRYSGYSCPAAGQEVIVDYFKTYVGKDGQSFICEIRFWGPTSGAMGTLSLDHSSGD